MKTTIISIPACASTNVLKSLHANNVQCKYVGIDQAGRILMQLHYEESKTGLISEMVSYMESIEGIVNEFTKVINDTISKLQEEADKEWRTKINKMKIRFSHRKNKKEEQTEQEATVN